MDAPQRSNNADGERAQFQSCGHRPGIPNPARMATGALHCCLDAADTHCTC